MEVLFPFLRLYNEFLKFHIKVGKIRLGIVLHAFNPRMHGGFNEESD